AVRQRLSRARTELKEEILNMMSMTFEQKKLPVGFTFRIMETVKQIKINPVSQMKGLPWGLSLATGLLVAVLSFNSHFIMELFGTYGGSALPVEQKVLKIGEIPVDALKISNMVMLSNLKGNGNGGGANLQNSFFMAPQGEGEWIKKADMPTGRRAIAAVTVNDKIYVIGGIGKGANFPVLSTVEEYDPVADKWTAKTDMPRARYLQNSASVVDGKIYAIGGVIENAGVYTAIPFVEEYDPIKDIWTKKKDMPTARYSLATCAMNGKIYAIGGFDDNDKVIPPVEEYDPSTDIWTKKNNMPIARGSLGLVMVNNRIYAIGGYDFVKSFTTVEEYDPIADQWTRKSDLPFVSCSFGTCVVNKKIYIIGVVDGATAKNYSTMLEYDPAKDKWTEKKEMQVARSALSAVAINGKIYAIGGGNPALDGAMSTIEEYDTGFVSESVNAKGKLPTTLGQKKQINK
ncbi:MAG: hypothetical protein NTY22_07045, partial [Proteobacteria bacterium]|nr:hypothetical protein [Pseudomonadota bacterium]